MSAASGLIDDLEKTAKLFQLGLFANFAEGILVGTIIGAYFIAKHNALATLDAGALLGIGLSIASALIWTIVTVPWQKKVNLKEWLKIIGSYVGIYSASAFMGYFFGTLIGSAGALILSILW